MVIAIPSHVNEDGLRRTTSRRHNEVSRILHVKLLASLTVPSCWGHQWEWTAEHPSKAKLGPLKHTYDELAGKAYDRALEIFREEQSQLKAVDTATLLQEKPNQPAPKPNVYNILKANASSDPVLGKLWAEVNTVPDWVDWDQLSRGQDVFYRYGMATMAGLAYQSLLGGFGAGKVVETLVRTGGFSPAIARRRLYETGQWNLEVTKNIESIKPGGEGWTSTVQVRLLHAAIRSRITKLTESRASYYNTETWGIPINDVDQAGTISSFCSAPIWLSLPRQGIYLRQDEIVDYVALWRYLAYLIGAPTEFFETPEKARKFQEAVLVYEINPTETSRLLAQNLVKGLERQPPLFYSADMIIAGARWLNGDKLIDELGLYRPSVFYKSMITLQMLIYMAVAYTFREIRYLDRMKIEYLKRMFWKVLVDDKNALAGKKTDFQMKYTPSYDNKTELHQSYATRPLRDWNSFLTFTVGLAGFAIAIYCYVHGTAWMGNGMRSISFNVY